MSTNYKGPGIYRHYKGGEYEVIGLAVREETVLKPGDVGYALAKMNHTPTGTTVVVYKPLTPGSILEERTETMWTRELADFNEQRVRVRIDGTEALGDAGVGYVPRFEFISESADDDQKNAAEWLRFYADEEIRNGEHSSMYKTAKELRDLADRSEGKA
jgi:hypothetical protein